MCRRTFTNRNLLAKEIHSRRIKAYRFIRGLMSYNGGESKAFSAHMPAPLFLTKFSGQYTLSHSYCIGVCLKPFCLGDRFDSPGKFPKAVPGET